ncbi:unnamed protein product, partial [Musa acuminata subsp. burmannicoides]
MEVDSEEYHRDISTDREEKGCRCEATDSRAMGMAAPWYRRGGTSVKSLIPCSHGGRALGRERG